MNLTDVLLLKYPGINFLTDVILQDDGDGPYIKQWNLQNVQPSQDQLNAWLNDTSIQTQIIINSSIAQLDSYISNKAKERQYDGALHICSYKDSTNTKWAAEATAFIAWRDQVWQQAIATQQAILSGQQQLTSLDQFIASLPALIWPS